uniref:PCI domain-containing protein n=1 Tax=Rhodosorus marinus TaxID=101924 RepID=A0A7S3EM15_9RHOD|mmetsp:Transcript_525/g.964  ORF Transcript_525/g.964 Transcript_525/m.964 type:complete len:250 (+) Transcript_525:2044-2793(+)|eukprot:CAMPEP_0113954442 /NCGR_PEP_ID=MMETSP0011_2-20120614/547_1 /TAXON_ID=101924 /ORGANISM="Rhodosorus marinus" /LENGTH=249 /DNA_ID=CAMNT_0000963555 /DNA_START=1939 /DNA_END=2688 /DNA_ORIENTATION=+ /assembly_acc=CAM_ASM_000156
MNGQEREARYCARLAGGEDVSAVVREAVRDPLLFQFGEILSLDRVSELCNSGGQELYDLLVLYAYGNMKDYETNISLLPEIMNVERMKLKQLTVLSQLSAPGDVSYATLMKELNITKVRELEDLIIELIYAKLLNATFDQKRMLLHFVGCTSRDVPNPDVLQRTRLTLTSVQPTVDVMLQSLGSWRANSARLLQTIDDMALDVREKELEKEGHDASRDAELEKRIAVVRDMMKTDMPLPGRSDADNNLD